jgi:hypothetical protein
LILQISAGHFEADRLVQHGFERANVTVRSPEFELGIPRCSEPRNIVVVSGIQIDPGKCLRVAAIEPFREPYHRGQRTHGASKRSAQVAIPVVRALWCCLPVIARDKGHDLDLLRIEPTQIPILDQVIRMAMMPLVTDVHADVVQQRAEFEPFPLAIGQAVHASRLVEDVQRESRHLLRVLGPIAAAFAQFDDASPADVRIALDFADPGAVAMDVIENQALPQREIAEREFVGTEPPHNRIEQHRSGDAQVGPARIESRHGKTFLDVGGDERLAEPTQCFRADAPVPKILRGRASFRGGHGTKTQDRP